MLNILFLSEKVRSTTQKHKVIKNDMVAPSGALVCKEKNIVNIKDNLYKTKQKNGKAGNFDVEVLLKL